MATQAEIVREYLANPDYKEMPSLRLAKVIYKKNSLAFKDVEGARQVIRRQRGQLGEHHRKAIKDKTHFKAKGSTNPFKLPESYKESREPYILPVANNNILLVSDFHVPYHDIPAITAAFKFGVENNINTVIINGDLLDFHQLSRFDKDPRSRSVREEFDAARALLQSMRETFPKAKIIWLKGNHCKRYEKWLYAKAPEIFDDPYFQLDERLRLNELKVELLDDLQLIKAGKLHITHGHMIVRGVFAPVNAARGAYLRAKTSTIIGHTHSVSEHTEKDLKGELTTCWSTGCLCDLSPGYDPFTNKHSHGFAHIKTTKDGNYSVKNYRIFNGKIL